LKGSFLRNIIWQTKYYMAITFDKRLILSVE